MQVGVAQLARVLRDETHVRRGIEHWGRLPIALLSAIAVFHLASDAYARAHAPAASIAPSGGRLSVARAASAAPAPDDPPRSEVAEAPVDPSTLPERIDVDVGARDSQIEERLGKILRAAGWFSGSSVRAEEGIVFLEGTTSEERHRQWAGDLARRTEDVVAVVNRIELSPRSLTDVKPALQGLELLWTGFIRSTPLLLVGVLLLLGAYLFGRAATWAIRGSFSRRGQIDLVRDIVARALGIMVFTLGLYVALRIAGLTRLAATILGGTGVLGLVLGIAFRDIAENTLASILLTRQQPFRKGDLVLIDAIEGVVERLTVRATVLMTLDGNHVQIPNSTVYKSAIVNYTSNPTRRIDFSVGIGYGDAIARAQEVALAVISQHPAVLAEPEPWVLAESLGSAVVQLRIYVWLDGSRHSWLKVRSSIIRLVKRAFQEHGISMPDEAREVVFPEGVPVHLIRDGARRERDAAPARPKSDLEADSVSTGGEAGLGAEARGISDMARHSRSPESGEDLLARS
jgi:small-conductance mechanosensitive channel